MSQEIFLLTDWCHLIMQSLLGVPSECAVMWGMLWAGTLTQNEIMQSLLGVPRGWAVMWGMLWAGTLTQNKIMQSLLGVPRECAVMWVVLWAGTLTQNMMAVSRLWLAGREVQRVLDGSSSTSNGATPRELDPGAVSTLVEGVALNSTAELRDNGSEFSSLASSDLSVRIVSDGGAGQIFSLTGCYRGHGHCLHQLQCMQVICRLVIVVQK